MPQFAGFILLLLLITLTPPPVSAATTCPATHPLCYATYAASTSCGDTLSQSSGCTGPTKDTGAATGFYCCKPPSAPTPTSSPSTCLAANPNNTCLFNSELPCDAGYTPNPSLYCSPSGSQPRTCCASNLPAPTLPPPPPGGYPPPPGGYAGSTDPRTLGFTPLKYPCNQTADPEFHPQRPYPGSPCDPLIPPKDSASFSCGKSLNASGEVKFPATVTIPVTQIYPGDDAAVPGVLYWCSLGSKEVCSIKRLGFNISLDLTNAKIPIVGNTQDPLDDATKVNNYLNWYLFGTNPLWEAPQTAPPVSIPTPPPGSIPGQGTVIILKEYLDGRNGPEHDLSTGEHIRYTSEPGASGGRDYFRMYKNSNWEQFFLDSQGVGRREDTSWAPLPGFGPAHCTTGDEAVYTITPQQTYTPGLITNDGRNWTPRTSTVGSSWQTSFQITPISKPVVMSSNDRFYCSLRDLGGYPSYGTTTLLLSGYWPANSFSFCTGIKNTADLIQITITGGPGTGDNFYFMKGWGFVGFEAPGFKAGLMGPGANASSCFGTGTPGPLSPIDRMINYSGPLKKLLPWQVQHNIRQTLKDGPIGTSYHNYTVLPPTRLGNAFEAIFKYIPFSSLEDITDEFTISILPNQQPGNFSPYDPSLKDYLQGGRVISESDVNNDNAIFLTIRPENQNQTDSRLYFPHLRSLSVLSSLLASMFKPLPDKLSSVDTGTYAANFSGHQTSTQPDYLTSKNTRNTELDPDSGAPPALFENYDQRCDLKEVRVNPGDSLIGSTVTGRLAYTQYFRYTPITVPTPAPGQNFCSDGTGASLFQCYKETGGLPYGNPADWCCPGFSCDWRVNEQNPDGGTYCHGGGDVYLPTEGRIATFVKTPLIDTIYDTLVVGPKSIFNRFFPKRDPLADPRPGGRDIPAPADAAYSATGANIAPPDPLDLTGEIYSAPDRNSAATAGDKSGGAQVYFKHLGSIMDYFLGAGCDNLNLQRLIRPLGFSSSCIPSSTPPSPTPTPSTASRNILTLGDSITAGYYPCKLQPLVPGATFLGPPSSLYCTVNRAGFTGKTAGWVNSNPLLWLPYVPTSSNAYILIHLGTNDVYEGIPTSTTISDLQGIVQKIKGQNSQAKIVLAKIIPSKDNDMSVLNNAITSSAFSGVTIINAGAGFDPNIHIPPDPERVHPNEAGGLIIAQNFLPAL